MNDDQSLDQRASAHIGRAPDRVTGEARGACRYFPVAEQAVERVATMLAGGADLDEVRRLIATLMIAMIASKPTLTYWEKLNFDMAIRLLPTAWLRLCLSHLNMTMYAPEQSPEDRERTERSDYNDAATGAGLIARIASLGYTAHHDNSDFHPDVHWRARNEMKNPPG